MLVHLVMQFVMTDPLSSLTLAQLNSLLDINFNLYLNSETTIQGDMYNVMYRQPDTLYEPPAI